MVLSQGARSLALIALFLAAGSAFGQDAASPATADVGAKPSVQPEAAAPAVPGFADPCGAIEAAAATHGLPLDFLTRLLWQESRFKPGAVSPKGAQGIAQFMPGTAADRGLADPFDPDSAIWAAASLLGELRRTFGNLGLAAAAYNGGPTRVANWLAATGTLPLETQDYVRIITGHLAEEWAADNRFERDVALLGEPKKTSCPEITLALARRAQPEARTQNARPSSAWGVQLAGSFSRNAALRVFAALKLRYGAVLAAFDPEVISRRSRGRGSRAFHRVRIGAPSRAGADTLCGRLRRAGAACVVLRN